MSTEPEVLDAPIALRPGLRVVACPHPFSVERVDRVVRVGGTLADILREVGVDPVRASARVFVDDWLIEKEWWPRVKPRAGCVVTIRVVASGGGGGGGGGKNPVRIIAMIAVTLIAAYITYQTAGALSGPAWGAWGAAIAGLAGAATGMVGALAVNALVPPPAGR